MDAHSSSAVPWYHVAIRCQIVATLRRRLAHWHRTARPVGAFSPERVAGVGGREGQQHEHARPRDGVCRDHRPNDNALRRNRASTVRRVTRNEKCSTELGAPALPHVLSLTCSKITSRTSMGQVQSRVTAPKDPESLFVDQVVEGRAFHRPSGRANSPPVPLPRSRSSAEKPPPAAAT